MENNEKNYNSQNQNKNQNQNQSKNSKDTPQAPTRKPHGESNNNN